jgi:hypothetical protein
MTKKLLGHVAVDSGQLIIVDPCYLKAWKDGDYDKTDNHYGKTCSITDNQDRGGEVTVSPIAGNGVAFRTGGDGGFPVYAHYRKDGSISKIEITNFW